jgi:FixJ family two-component response regulator
VIVGQRKEEIDLVLTDVEMKPISGFEFVKRMKHNKIEIPTLFMSGDPNMAGVIATGLGPGVVIEKPFAASVLRQKVSRCLAKIDRHATPSRLSTTA